MARRDLLSQLPSTTSLVAAKPDPSFGPTKPLSAQLLKLLEEWHLKHPGPPPCSIGKYDNKEWKVFDRESRVVELSRFQISSPCSYYMLVLYCANGSEKICSFVGERATKYGRYLVGWMGLEKGFESESCAIRVTGLAANSIVIDPKAWQYPPKYPTPMRLCLPLKILKGRGASQTERGAKSTTPSPSMRQVQEGQSSSPISDAACFMEEASDKSSTSQEDPDKSSDGDIIPFDMPHSLKRRRVDSPPSSAEYTRNTMKPNPHNSTVRSLQSNNDNIALPIRDWEVVFIFIHEPANATLAWAVNGPDPGNELFARAQLWYQVFDKDAKINLLSFQIPGSGWTRHIFESDSHMVEYFIDEVKRIKTTKEGKGTTTTIPIEVKHVV